MPAPAFALMFATFSRIIAQRAAGAAASAAATGARGAAGASGQAAGASRGTRFAEILASRVSPTQHVMEKKQQAREELAGSIGTGLGKAEKALEIFGGVLGVLTVVGKKLADAQLEHQKQYAKFNGTIAVAYAKLQKGDIVRSRMSAAATAGTTHTLVNATNELRDNARPIQDLGANINNAIGIVASKILSAIIYLPGKIAAAILPKNPFAQAGPWQASLNELAKEARAKHLPGKLDAKAWQEANERLKKINRRLK
jgi:hypothetical protein